MLRQRAQPVNPQGFVAKVEDRLSGTYRLAKALPEFFRERVTVEQAQEQIRSEEHTSELQSQR